MGADDDGPDGPVSTEVGITGVALFSVLLIATLFSANCAKNKYSKRLFVCSSIMSVLELPRYITLILEHAYNNKTTYIVHMWAGVLFFMAFTCVIYVMHDAVDLSHSHSPLATMITKPKSLADRIVIDKTGLVALNILFALITLATSVCCMSYHSLYDFFHQSVMYAVYTLCDAIKNLIVAGAFLFYGCRLRARIHIFSSTSVFGGSSASLGEVILLQKLKKVVRRLLTVMVLCLCCFIVRTIMLIIKGVAVEEDNIHIAWLPNYGFLWWVCSDFIPRGVPIIAFVTFFGGPSRLKSRQSSKHAGLRSHHLSLDNSRIRFDSDEEDADPDGDGDKSSALLGEDGDREADETSSYGDGSGHKYRRVLEGMGGGGGGGGGGEGGSAYYRESTGSIESTDTTSTSHTVFRNTATTSEFSTSYRPYYGGRKSENVNYAGGSVIVNALMWPVGSAHNPHNQQQQSRDSTNSTSNSNNTSAKLSSLAAVSANYTAYEDQNNDCNASGSSDAMLNDTNIIN